MCLNVCEFAYDLVKQYMGKLSYSRPILREIGANSTELACVDGSAATGATADCVAGGGVNSGIGGCSDGAGADTGCAAGPAAGFAQQGQVPGANCNAGSSAFGVGAVNPGCVTGGSA